MSSHIEDYIFARRTMENTFKCLSRTYNACHQIFITFFTKMNYRNNCRRDNKADMIIELQHINRKVNNQTKPLRKTLKILQKLLAFQRVQDILPNCVRLTLKVLIITEVDNSLILFFLFFFFFFWIF